MRSSLLQIQPNQENAAQHPHQDGNVLRPAADDGTQNEAQNPENNALRDAVGQQHYHHGHQRRKTLAEVRKVDMAQSPRHQKADDDQNRRRRKRRDQQKDRRKEQRRQKQPRRGDGGQPRFAAFGHARRAFGERRDRRRTEGRPHDRPERVGDQRFLHIDQRAVLIRHPRLARDADQRAERVENIHKEQREEHHEEVERQHAFPAEIKEQRFFGQRHRRKAFGQPDQSQRERDRRYGKDADQKRAPDLFHEQNHAKDQPRQSQERFGRFQRTDRYERRRTGHDDLAVLEPDECDEKADRRGDRRFQERRDAADEDVPRLRQGQKKEQDAFAKHGRQRGLIAVSHHAANRISEKRVQPHSGRQHDGQIRPKPHQQRYKDRSDDRRRKDRAGRHSRRGQNRGIDR